MSSELFYSPLIYQLPLIVSTSDFPLQHLPDLLRHIPEAKSISQLLWKQYDCNHVRQCTYVSIRPVRSHDARLLPVPLNQSILLGQPVNGDHHGEIIENTVTRFRGDGVE